MASRGIEDIFADMLERARVLDPVNTRNWFDELVVLNFKGGALEIGCPNEATVQFLQDNCKNTFTHAAQQITGHLVTVNFRINDGRMSGAAIKSSRPEPRLHPDYTFESFVVGPSNRLAHASCIAVSQTPGTVYNPLFVYGNSGLGKTHLLHAICHETGNTIRGAVIEFLSCENFVNRFISAIEKGDLTGFQKQFRSVDVLVLDDIQFLSEREHSQEEFFHTFNTLYNNGKQIVLSADCLPSEIAGLEERLTSRFNWGLVARIDPPTHETRVAIVQKKAHLRGLSISDAIAEYIAKKVQANIRELEGALTTIYAVANTTKREITLELAKEALEGIVDSSTKYITISDIVKVVTNHFNVRITDLQSKKRSQSITEPRQICMYLARDLTRHSLEEIGGHLGGRDHTTVMHACSKIGQAKAEDKKMQALLNELTKQISQPAAV